MAFFRSLKRAFGFSDDGLETNDELDGINGAQAARRPYVNPFADDKQSQPAEKKTENAASQSQADDLSQQLLSQVIAIVNRNLPPFVLDNLDLEAERKAIGEELKPSVDAFVSQVNNAAQAQTTSDKNAIAELNEKIKNIEAQRRAVLAKFNDAQNKVATFEAEREQFELENKSLLNKIKVMRVKAGDTDFGDLDEAVASYDDSKRKLEELTKEYKQKMEITSALISDLQSDASAKAKQVKELTESLEQAQKQIEQLQEQCNAQQAKLDESQGEADLIDEVQAKIEQFEQFKITKQQEIDALRKQLEQTQSSSGTASMQIEDYKKQVAELEKTIDRLTRSAAETAERHNRRDIEVANRYNDLKTNYNNTLSKLQEAQAQVDQLKADATVTQNIVDEMTRKNEALAVKYRDTNAMLTLAQDELADAKEKQQLTQAQLKSSLDELESARNELNTTREQLQESKTQLQTTQGELHDSQSQLQSAQDELYAVKSQIIELESAPTAPEEPVATPEPATVPKSTEPEPIEFDVLDSIESVELEPIEQTAEPEPVEAPKPEPIEPAESKPVEAPKNEPTSPVASALDDLDELDDIDWLVPTPPTPKQKEPEEPEPQPAPRKSKPDDRQMSLF